MRRGRGAMRATLQARGDETVVRARRAGLRPPARTRAAPPSRCSPRRVRRWRWPRLEPSAATDTLVGRSTSSWQATERYRDRFGEQSVIVLVRGDVANLVLTQNLEPARRARGLPARATCPKGQPAAGRQALAVRRARGHQAGAGGLRPGHVHQLRRGRDPDAAAEAHAGHPGAGEPGGRRRRASSPRARGRSPAQQEARGRLRAAGGVRAAAARPAADQPESTASASSGVPTLNDTNFVSALVFDATRGARTPKARFAYLFPNRKAWRRSRCGWSRT